MVRYHIYPSSLIQCADCNDKKAFARFIRKLGDDVADIIELARADRLSAQGEAVTKEMTEVTLNHLNNLLNYYNEVKLKGADTKVLLDGNEIMKILNIKPSKTIGIILEQLKEAQISGEVNSKEHILSIKKTEFMLCFYWLKNRYMLAKFFCPNISMLCFLYLLAHHNMLLQLHLPSLQ